MSLARCPNPECDRVLDVPEIPASWRAPDGRCASCNNLTKEDFMHLPTEVFIPPENARKFKVEHGVRRGAFEVTPGVKMPSKKDAPEYKGMYPFNEMRAPRPDGSMDSFLVPAADAEEIRLVRLRLSSAMYDYKKRFAPKSKFQMHTMAREKGVRVWRTK